MKDGALVKCLNTGVIGVVLKTQQSSFSTHILVQWPNKQEWVDTFEVQKIDAD